MKKKAILCVDDEKTVLESIKAQLKKRFHNQYHYEIAESAKEAWEVIDELADDGFEILVIVSDWCMPGMKGDEFLIRVHSQFPTIVKILLTGQADQKAVERAQKEANLFRYLTKPWEEKTLIDTISSSVV